MYTDHQATDDQCALMISVAPAVPPFSAHQCYISVPQVTLSCLSVPPINASQCCLSVPPNSASQYHKTVPVSAAYQRRI
ncbi:unnamed protein product [Staurois parvus]|uniref:Uncharacterized protein n=1 Tax=Staurois parvus TaxID=386267 RepID=A0ABN9CT73_9NEOB|nr:unnamed protein product [Staurois parvus]